MHRSKRRSLPVPSLLLNQWAAFSPLTSPLSMPNLARCETKLLQKGEIHPSIKLRQQQRTRATFQEQSSPDLGRPAGLRRP